MMSVDLDCIQDHWSSIVIKLRPAARGPARHSFSYHKVFRGRGSRVKLEVSNIIAIRGSIKSNMNKSAQNHVWQETKELIGVVQKS